MNGEGGQGQGQGHGPASYMAVSAPEVKSGVAGKSLGWPSPGGRGLMLGPGGKPLSQLLVTSCCKIHWRIRQLASLD